MIAQLKAKKAVVIDTFNNKEEMPIVKLVNFIEEEEGYRVNGCYFYKKKLETPEGEPEKFEDIIISQFGFVYTVAEANALYAALNIQYPQGASFDTCRKMEKMAGLKYVVATQKRWGLTITDWE